MSLNSQFWRFFGWRVRPECCTGRVQEELGVISSRISRPTQSLWKQCGQMRRQCQVISVVLSTTVLPLNANYWNWRKTNPFLECGDQCCENRKILKRPKVIENSAVILQRWKYAVKSWLFCLCESSKWAAGRGLGQIFSFLGQRWRQRCRMFVGYIQWIPESGCESKRKTAKSQRSSHDNLF